MKAVIPAAGIGTRLRPHTLNKPKALLPVAGRPILGHIVDDLTAAGIDGFVIIVGYGQEKVRDWLATERPALPVTFVEQAERLGLGHAVRTARTALADEPFFCILGDTILKADYAKLLAADTSLIAVREVEDPRRFGVVEMDGEWVTRFVEKPDQPRSNLAIVGAYLFHDPAALWTALDRIVADDIRTKGEFQLTDALQLMVEGGCRFRAELVADWYDCGERQTWLQTNQVLLAQQEGRAAEGVTPPCALGRDVVLSGSRIGPHVSIGPGSRIENCELADCVVGANSRLVACRLTGSLVGDNCLLEGAEGQVDVGDFCQLRCRGGRSETGPEEA